MSDTEKTPAAKDVNTEATEVTTLNTHATSEPMKPVTLTSEDAEMVTQGNTHATDEEA
ncbi:hypothetical protein [Streptomyces sp. NPDC059631]|uniref:hypothetical protein n=1 Tax=unclassified Streptomyces TaxID=2593676 RepID=UPI00369551DB